MTSKASLNIRNPQNWRMVRALVLMTSAWCAGGLAQGTYKDSRIQALGQVFAQPERVVDEQVRMIFYRTPQSSSVQGAASVYVNGAYHASLVPGGYSELCMPAGNVELGLKTVEVGRTVKDDLDTIALLRTMGGQTQYLRVKEAGRGRQVLVPVHAQEALKELAGTREQIHTISRVPGATECNIQRAGAAAFAAAPAQTVTLAADALFAFGRADLPGMSPMGRAALDALVTRLRSQYIQLDRLHVIGHADPIGQPAANDLLSMQRAQTVREYLLQSGLNQVQITSEGRGAREPAVTQCSLSASPEAISCHAPNRRVAIDIQGARR